MERNSSFSSSGSPVAVISAALGKVQRSSPIGPHPDFHSIGYVLITVIILLSLPSCSTVSPTVNRPVPILKKNTAAANVRPLLPEGWADITSRSKQPQIIQWIVNREYSATMVLRELQTDSSTNRMLMKEGLNVVAEISLRNKVSKNDADLRVTRVPAMAEGKRRISTYVYTERGLLRRVAVFMKRERFMELELMQEQSGAAFDELNGALLEFAGMVQDR